MARCVCTSERADEIASCRKGQGDFDVVGSVHGSFGSGRTYPKTAPESKLDRRGRCTSLPNPLHPETFFPQTPPITILCDFAYSLMMLIWAWLIVTGPESLGGRTSRSRSCRARSDSESRRNSPERGGREGKEDCCARGSQGQRRYQRRDQG